MTTLKALYAFVGLEPSTYRSTPHVETDPTTTSFTNQRPRIATAEDLAAKWNGRTAHAAFRCRLCGHRFRVGDKWRWVYANFSGSEVHFGNFFVCQQCDEPNVLARAAEQEREAEQRFWWFRGE